MQPYALVVLSPEQYFDGWLIGIIFLSALAGVGLIGLSLHLIFRLTSNHTSHRRREELFRPESNEKTKWSASASGLTSQALNEILKTTENGPKKKP